MGKKISLIVKAYAALFGSICYVAYFVMHKTLPTQSMVSGIVIMMLAFEGLVLSVDTSMVIKNIKNKKEDLEEIKK